MHKQQIIDRVEEITKSRFGEKFTYRPGQREAIIDILDAYYNMDVDTYILEAPTGSGKSLIAMIASSVLESNSKTGYILTSELALQDQYAQDFRAYGLTWGHIKGASTYQCAVNFQPFPMGECRLQKMSYEQAEELPCFEECGYLMNRKRSIKSPVSLLNYSYALIQRNYVEAMQLKKGKTPPFEKRDFVFCDEAHRLIDIVQGHFAPRINQELLDAVKYLDTFQQKNGFGSSQLAPQMSSVIFLMEYEEDKAEILKQLKDLYQYLAAQMQKNAIMNEAVSKQYDNWNNIPVDWKKAIAYADFAKDAYCKVEDFVTIIESVGSDKIVKTVNPTIKESNEIVLNCVEEGYMVDKHFSQKFGFKILMSATIGSPRYFMKAIGSQNVRFNRIPSHFDFANSPIYFTPHNRVTYKAMDEKIPVLIGYVKEILLKHNDKPGIIHSGSYSLAKKIWMGLPGNLKARVKLYEGSSEKTAAVGNLTGNTIVIGPSLLEGIDLKDDLSRLQIFLKVPYPSLGNNFVKEKMNYYPDWYRWRAATAVAQGVGRSVRSAEDWCITYFLDGCLTDLMKDPLAFPKDFLNRIINIETI